MQFALDVVLAPMLSVAVWLTTQSQSCDRQTRPFLPDIAHPQPDTTDRPDDKTKHDPYTSADGNLRSMISLDLACLRLLPPLV